MSEFNAYHTRSPGFITLRYPEEKIQLKGTSVAHAILHWKRFSIVGIVAGQRLEDHNSQLGGLAQVLMYPWWCRLVCG